MLRWISQSSAADVPSIGPRTAAQLPRLQIIHLLALTAIFSLVMAMSMGLARFLGHADEIRELSGGMSTLVIMDGLSTSVCVTVGIFGLVWRKRGIAFPSQPGHWVALYLTLNFASTYLGIVRTLVRRDVLGFEWVSWLGMPMSLVFRCLALALWVFAYRNESAQIWKWGWAAMALRSIFSVARSLLYLGAALINWFLEVFWYRHVNWQPDYLLNSLFGPSSGLWMLLLTNYACVAFLIAATTSDFRHDRRRHWSHWLVLIPLFISTLVQIPYYHWMLKEYF